MKLKWRVLRLVVLSCILLTSVFAIGNVLTGRSSTGSGEGFILVKPAFAQSADASFLEQEAGMAAYVNAARSLDLAKAKAAYRTIEKETASYIVGSVPLPDYPVSEDVHLYVCQDGWIVAYYLATEPESKIVDWLNYSPGKIPTKLELGLTMVSNSLGLPINGSKFYHFKYPDANRLIVAAKSDGTFKLTIPSGMSIYARSWSYDFKYEADPHTMRIGSLTPSQLSSSIPHEVNVQAYPGWNPTSEFKIDGMRITSQEFRNGKNQQSAAIVLIYRE